MRERRYWGLLATLWAKAMASARPWLFLCKVLVRELETDTFSSEPDDDISIRLANRQELERAAKESPHQLNAEFVDKALERGDICLAAFRNEQMVSWVWRSFSTAPHEDGLWVRVEKPYWYTYKTYTHRDFRGRRLTGLLTLYGDEFCRGSGYQRGVGFIETHNYASMRANLRLGTQVVGFAGYVRLLGKTYPFRSSRVVPHTFRFYVRKESHDQLHTKKHRRENYRD